MSACMGNQKKTVRLKFSKALRIPHMRPWVTAVALYGRGESCLQKHNLSPALTAFWIRDMGSQPGDATLGSPKVACSLGTERCC